MNPRQQLIDHLVTYPTKGIYPLFLTAFDGGGVFKTPMYHAGRGGLRVFSG